MKKCSLKERTMCKKIFTCLFLAMITLAVYRQTVNHQFITYDNDVISLKITI